MPSIQKLIGPKISIFEKVKNTWDLQNLRSHLEFEFVCMSTYQCGHSELETVRDAFNVPHDIFYPINESM